MCRSFAIGLASHASSPAIYALFLKTFQPKICVFRPLSWNTSDPIYTGGCRRWTCRIRTVRFKGGSSIFCSCDIRQPTSAGKVLGVVTHCSGRLVCISRENLSYQLVGFQEIVTVVLYVNRKRGNEVPILVSQVVGGHDVVPRTWSLPMGSAHCRIRQLADLSLWAGDCILGVEFWTTR